MMYCGLRSGISMFLTFFLLHQQSYSRAITIQFRKDEESRAFHCAFEQWKKEVVIQGAILISTCSFFEALNAI